MDIAHMVSRDARPLVRKSGYSSTSEAAGHIWAVFPRKEAEELVGWVASDCDVDFAERLTGLSEERSCLPGQTFADNPQIRVFRHAILVSQFRGLDI